MQRWTLLWAVVLVCCASSTVPLFPETVAFSPTESDQAPPSVPRSSWTGGSAGDGPFELWTDPGELPRLEVDGDEAAIPLPLEHTHVSATLHGFVAEVEVRQTYKNSATEPIEVVYTFPLPENSAVHQMKMIIGKRTIEAKIEEREKARRMYDDAKRIGYTAALLEQERPNVFTQSVANIEPGQKINVVIRYVQDLSYDQGEFEFVFPMVVGPRFMPGEPLERGRTGTGWQRDTTRVPDASRVSPPYVGKGTRSGHDISIEVVARTGFPVTDYRAVTHEVGARTSPDGSIRLALAKKGAIANRDFILRYRAGAEEPRAVLHTSAKDARHGYFSLAVYPPTLDVESLVGRREIIFVVDVSGSMSGTPLSLCREAMRAALARLRPVDTFNIVTFAGHAMQAFETPRPANRHNVGEGLRVIDGLRAGGGTQMVDAIDKALGTRVERGRHRYVFFMTDGYVGNEEEIADRSKVFVRALEERGQRARVFGFGVGSSPNRHLIDALSRAGNGIAVYASNREHPDRAVNRFYHYIDRAVLTNVSVDWAKLRVEDLQPREVPDLFASHAIVLHGRYRGTPSGKMTLRANAGKETVEIPVRIEPAVTDGAPTTVLGTLWARSKVQHLEEALLSGEAPDAQQAIVKLGLEFNIVTRYTSFIAVDTSRVVGDGTPEVVVQPNERPEDVDLEMAGYSESALSGAIHEQIYAVAQVDPKRGCGCRVAGRHGNGAWTGALLVLFAALSRRKRRHSLLASPRTLFSRRPDADTRSVPCMFTCSSTPSSARPPSSSPSSPLPAELGRRSLTSPIRSSSSSPRNSTAKA